MGRYALLSNVSRVVETYDGAFVVASSKRPASDLIEPDRVRTPTEPIVPGEEDSLIRDDDGATSDDGFTPGQRGTEHRLAVGLSAMRPFSDASVAPDSHAARIRVGEGCRSGGK
jgi:hypothetical protein